MPAVAGRVAQPPGNAEKPAGTRAARALLFPCVVTPPPFESLRTTLLSVTRAAREARLAAASSAPPPSGVQAARRAPAPFVYRRLREELEAHGAPVELVAAARRVETEELDGVAREREEAVASGHLPSRPWRVAPAFEIRHLVLVTLEAAEACVLGAYRAAECFALGDPSAESACRRAELAYRVLVWSWPSLAAPEQRVIAAAVARSADRLGRRDPLTIGLARSVFAPLAAACAA